MYMRIYEQLSATALLSRHAVVSLHWAPCGACSACRDGRPTHCSNNVKTFFGLTVNGGYADYAVNGASAFVKVCLCCDTAVAACLAPLALGNLFAELVRGCQCVPPLIVTVRDACDCVCAIRRQGTRRLQTRWRRHKRLRSAWRPLRQTRCTTFCRLPVVVAVAHGDVCAHPLPGEAGSISRTVDHGADCCESRGGGRREICGASLCCALSHTLSLCFPPSLPLCTRTDSVFPCATLRLCVCVCFIRLQAPLTQPSWYGCHVHCLAQRSRSCVCLSGRFPVLFCVCVCVPPAEHSCEATGCWE